jgi:molybdate transport system ATP-binding protein
LILPNTCWEIKTNQQWAILGPNGSGKSSLARALTGDMPVVRGTITHNCQRPPRDSIGYVSLELQQRLIEREEGQDEARFFSGGIGTFIKARQTILSTANNTDTEDVDLDRIVSLLDINYLLDRSIRYLSAGEMRKVLIARALMKSPRLLILDEPFEGLDEYSRNQLAELIVDLTNQQIQIILVTHRSEEILPEISHILCLKDCRVFLKGRREEVLASGKMGQLHNENNLASLSDPKNGIGSPSLPTAKSPVLIVLKNTTVKYGDVPVLDNLNWTMKYGENWAILGPNGSGKSTLLSLIIGDNPQAYTNEVYLFGRRRGSGESIWDIKKRVSIVSSELQVHYRKRMRVFDVVLSGFHDSIGLYRRSTGEQKSAAQHWMEIIGIYDKAKLWFDQLSYGQKRMVLLARSMVKLPTLLVLDEPCEGLDQLNRRIILEVIDDIGKQTQTHLLYVTHHQDEIPICITKALRLEKGRHQA